MEAYVTFDTPTDPYDTFNNGQIFKGDYNTVKDSISNLNGIIIHVQCTKVEKIETVETVETDITNTFSCTCTLYESVDDFNAEKGTKIEIDNILPDDTLDKIAVAIASSMQQSNRPA